jgi:cyclase
VSVAVRVIACLDVDAGRVVKGVNFAGLRDAGDPVELARRYDEQGADELTFLDITASSAGRETTFDVVRRTAEQVFIPLTVGGGVRSVADVDALLRAGADKVGVNTAAIARPDLLTEIAQRFGRQVLVLSVDARRVPACEVSTASGFEVTTHGGRRGAGIDVLHHDTLGDLEFQGVRIHPSPAEDTRDVVQQAAVLELPGGQIDTHRQRLARVQRLPGLRLTTGCLQDPFANRHDQPGFFGERDERIRGHQSQVRVLPAHQGFEAGDQTGGQRHDGLIGHAELPMLDGVAELRLQFQALHGALVHARIEHLEARLTERLGAIHRQIRAA